MPVHSGEVVICFQAMCIISKLMLMLLFFVFLVFWFLVLRAFYSVLFVVILLYC